MKSLLPAVLNGRLVVDIYTTLEKAVSQLFMKQDFWQCCVKVQAFEGDGAQITVPYIFSSLWGYQ